MMQLQRNPCRISEFDPVQLGLACMRTGQSDQHGSTTDMTGVGLNNLTTSERDVLALLSRGYDVKASAQELGITQSAATERLRSARRKLGVTSSREAARLLVQSENASYSFSGDSFSGLAAEQGQRPNLAVPAGQAERNNVDPVGSDLRELQLAYAGFDEAPKTVPYIPLRGVDAEGNSLSKTQRVQAVVDLSIKIAAVAALVCMIALVLNMVSLS